MIDVDIAQLPDDVAQLKEIIARYKDLTTHLKHEIILLNERVQTLLHRRFARRSEKQDPKEGYVALLFDEIETISEEKPKEQEETVEVKSYIRRKCGRKAICDELPRVTFEYDIEEEKKQCTCGAMMVRIGQDVREQIDKIPAILFVRREIRHKYACKKCEGVNEAGEHKGVVAFPFPRTFIPRSIASAGLVADIIVSKFCDHVPLYRQEKIFAREGVALSSTTLSSIALLAARQCEKVILLMKEDLKKSRFVGCDETALQVMRENGRKDTAKSWMWVFRGEDTHPVTLFHYSCTRSNEVLSQILSGYKGVIQSDDFGAYGTFVNASPSIVGHVGCMAHARRKFVEALKVTKSPIAQSVVAQMGKLYALEEEFRSRKLSEEEIASERKKRAVPILEDIRAQLEKEMHHVPPKSLVGKAIRYFLDNYVKLIRYVDFGFVPIDNNAVENAIRPFVVGRKNWLFSGSPRGARASALLFSIIETAKRCGHEPYWYLRYLFEKLPYAESEDEIRALLPYHINPKDIPANLNVQHILETILAFQEKEVQSA